MRVFIETNEKLISTALLILRVTLGVVFFAHGSQKVLGIFGGRGLAATAAMLSKGLPLPAWLFCVSAFAEFLGGIGMVLGLLTRFWGLALVINMCVAVFAVHWPHGFFLPMGFEYPMTMGLLALSILVAGPGLYSLDYVLFGNPSPANEPRQAPFKVPGGTAQFRPDV